MPMLHFCSTAALAPSVSLSGIQDATHHLQSPLWQWAGLSAGLPLTSCLSYSQFKNVI